MKNIENNENLFVELTEDEEAKIEGGSLGPAVIAGLVAGLVVSFIDNFQDVKNGLYDGYMLNQPRH